MGREPTGPRRASIKRKRLAAGRKWTSSRVRVLMSRRWSPMARRLNYQEGIQRSQSQRSRDLGRVSSMRQLPKACRMRAVNVVAAPPVTSSREKETSVGEQPTRLEGHMAQVRLRTALGQAATPSKLALGTAPTVPRVVGSRDQRNAMIWGLLLAFPLEHCPRMLRI